MAHLSETETIAKKIWFESFGLVTSKTSSFEALVHHYDCHYVITCIYIYIILLWDKWVK